MAAELLRLYDRDRQPGEVTVLTQEGFIRLATEWYDATYPGLSTRGSYLVLVDTAQWCLGQALLEGYTARLDYRLFRARVRVYNRQGRLVSTKRHIDPATALAGALAERTGRKTA